MSDTNFTEEDKIQQLEAPAGQVVGSEPEPQVSNVVVGENPVSGPLRSRPKLAVVVLVVILVVAGSGLALLNHLNGAQRNVSFKQATVEITSNGFVPSSLLVNPGTEVTWKNNTNSTQAVGSIPFPTHTSLPGLVSGELAPNQSFSYVFSTVGSWQYQNDMMPLNNGSIVVKN